MSHRLLPIAAALALSHGSAGAAPVAHWTFDEGAGTLAAGAVLSSAQDGTLTDGPTWNVTTNPVGAAGVEFVDTDDIVLTNYAGITALATIPEPSGSLLLGVAGIALILRRRK